MKSTKLYLIGLFFGVLFLAGCEYTFVQHPDADQEEPQISDPDNPISFATQIVPIFTSRCLDCHDTGGQAPDLTSANAYSSIASLVDTDNPASSLLYSYVEPTSSDHDWRQYTASQAALVLLWIQEGALNN